ncbi:MAG: DUF58 domain-containing protein [Lachnospiraceae bacterium]|nr:DUF58 domain-containing protein [Lachnospiraceae bacterium]
MLDAAYYGRLGRLKLLVDKKSNAALLGSRKSVRKGSSAEFSDFREYMPGDDIRNIDWNAYARLDRLYIKEYMEEKESRITFFVDFSRSMEYGEKSKAELLKELTAALSYIAMMNLDHVMLVDLADPAKRHIGGGGKLGYRQLTEWLERQEAGEPAAVKKTVASLGKMQPGLSVILSDFLSEEYVEDPSAIEQLIRYLQFNKQKVVILQILAKEELNIDLSGTFFLIDSEDKDQRLRVTMESSSIRSYEEELKRFTNGLQKSAKRCGATYHLVSTADSFDRIIFQQLEDIYEF